MKMIYLALSVTWHGTLFTMWLCQWQIQNYMSAQHNFCYCRYFFASADHATDCMHKAEERGNLTVWAE